MRVPYDLQDFKRLREDEKNIPNLRKYVVVAVKDKLKIFEEVVI